METHQEETDRRFLQEALALAAENPARGGGPFAALVVCDGEVLGRGTNRVTAQNDPTAHAEVEAIRAACRRLSSHQLTGCTVYASCEPCPMCLGAIYWARPEKFFYAGTREDAAAAGFDDEDIYEELALPVSGRRLPAESILRDRALELFREWIEMPDKITY